MRRQKNKENKIKVLVFTLLLCVAIGAGVYALFFADDGKAVTAEAESTMQTKPVELDKEEEEVVKEIEEELIEESPDLTEPEKVESVSHILNRYNQSYLASNNDSEQNKESENKGSNKGSKNADDPITKPKEEGKDNDPVVTKPGDNIDLPTPGDNGGDGDKPQNPGVGDGDTPQTPGNDGDDGQPEEGGNDDQPGDEEDNKPEDPKVDDPKGELKLTTWVPYWNKNVGRLQNNAKYIDEINIFEYSLDKEGNVVYLDADNNKDGNPEGVQVARQNGMKVIATIANTEGWSDYNKAAKELHDLINTPQKREKLAQNIASWAKKQGYDGVDLNLEVVWGRDRDNFSAFVEKLAEKMHADNKIVSVTVYPKESEPGHWDAPQSQDWKRLGAAADQIKIMTYNYSMEKPGAQAPLNWLDRVVSFAKTQIPAEKIYVGLPGYGYEWSQKNRLGAISYSMAQKRMEQYGIKPEDVKRDKNGEPYFTYQKDGQTYTVYFQDKTSWEKKFQFLLEKHSDIGGVVNWVMGQEDPEVWKHLYEMKQK